MFDLVGIFDLAEHSVLDDSRLAITIEGLREISKASKFNLPV
jgi:hypothetical protein